MGYSIVLLLGVGVTVYALVDCWRSSDDEVRGLPRPAWALIVILAFPLGGVAYLLFGRQPGGVPVQRRVSAPDDDPDFLRSLDVQRRRAAAEQRGQEQRERKEREEKERKEKERRRRRNDQRDPDGEGHTAP